MKPNLKVLDNTDPEFVNSNLDQKDLDDISILLKKRRDAKHQLPKAKPRSVVAREVLKN